MSPNNKSKPSIDGVYRTHRSGNREASVDHTRKLDSEAVTEPGVITEGLSQHAQDSIKNSKAINTIEQKPKNKKKRTLILSLFVLVSLLTAAGAALYNSLLAPVTSDKEKYIKVTIAFGSSPANIAETLYAKGVIRSQWAFGIYAKLSGNENKLKAGSYNLSPSLSTPKIIEHIVEGKEDTINVTFLPGDTLANGRKNLIDSGYSAEEVDKALKAVYDRPLFASKPKGSDLEGYLYGETISFSLADSVATVLGRFFDEYEAFIKKNDLEAKYEKQGLTLFQGITLASIVQRETSNPESQRQVARVFMNRMQIGMNLGSDVTYQYAAKKLGVPPNPNLDSPYNTRRYVGLPPGPIASPGNSALISVANPAENDYLYFLAGDDNKMYYAKSDTEHNQNIVKHCQIKCSVY